jgi:hypothetical protein
MGLVPNKSRISSGRAKTTMDIERKRASLELGLLYRYATTHLLGLASILEHLRFSFFTSALSIPVVRSGKESEPWAGRLASDQIPERSFFTIPSSAFFE